ncbi:hypothetical protein SAMD00019534_006740 [Acytostelium subglobosum LB1]|uniref:hypothetical protein n=1 Tax=Acytostelium subglobosum LB1 TaxID=1410327 RepID=UPI000644F267|nr:hypothetical protein SAMD00019534_006740 [Acytostelium subglobosum LB1]GAM17499.1 hypothetical protein SAMD00019534_006740 [Acytostelium subglobosum LB1]|eukprot:XP_012759561.1 hypothetical protein SAMD00019534_006740 [Acytostelium subglobosum LB1]
MSVYQKTATHAPAVLNNNQAPADDDDWDTDPEYVNDISEKAQRWGSKLIQPDEVFDDQTPNMQVLREKVFAKDSEAGMKEYQAKKILYGGERAAVNNKDL